jgi:hypothetical protein
MFYYFLYFNVFLKVSARIKVHLRIACILSAYKEFLISAFIAFKV